MAITELYVDPSIAADSGAGTIGDPYGDVEFCIRQETFDVTNGTRINVKDGVAELLVAHLETSFLDTSVSIAWVSTTTAPIVFRGYSLLAEDGGRGCISGNDLVSICDANTRDNVHFVDMELKDVGANVILNMDDHITLNRCWIHGCTGTTGYGVQLDNYCHVTHTTINDVGGRGGLYIDSGSIAAFNWLDFADSTPGTALYCYTSTTAYRNVIIMAQDDNGNGIQCINGANIIQNSLYVQGGGGTGTGIIAAQSAQGPAVINNIVVGWSGTGGGGITFGGYNRNFYGNAIYDCTDGYEITYAAEGMEVFAINETLTANPYRDPENGDFRPVRTGAIYNGARPFNISGQN